MSDGVKRAGYQPDFSFSGKKREILAGCFICHKIALKDNMMWTTLSGIREVIRTRKSE